MTGYLDLALDVLAGTTIEEGDTEISVRLKWKELFVNGFLFSPLTSCRS